MRRWKLLIACAAAMVFTSYLVALESGAQTAHDVVYELTKQPDPDCEKLTTGKWWKKKNHILDVNVDRDKVIAFAMYTHDRRKLKLTAQLYPLFPNETSDVTLEFKRGGEWTVAATQPINRLGWNTTFQVDNWDNTQNVSYRVRHGEKATYEGLIRRDPINKNVITLAAFSCDSPKGNASRDPYIRNVTHQDPDLIFFAGDQSYYHTEHTSGWLIWGRYYRELFRNRPCVTIPDDHDVGQGNLWGENGKKSLTQGADDGGYTYDPAYVKMVERTQTGHLPDPYDPTPIDQGIGVYYTNLVVGGVDFAILEDRKFKSGPSGKIPQQGPRPDHIRNPEYDPASVDVAGLVLLGERQLKFLEDWGSARPNAMKAVLSQTSFCGAVHLHGKKENRLHADMDCNGWPQTGRNKALRLIRQANAVHIAGDQHLGYLVQHGIDKHRDGPWVMCVPAAVNTYYGRWWWPRDEKAGANPDPGNPLPWNGDYLDGFANKITMYAYANADAGSNGDGYGLIKFNKKNREVTFECWPREVDVTHASAQQYLGWPRTISLGGNGRGDETDNPESN